jgi:hypothetical protein
VIEDGRIIGSGRDDCKVFCTSSTCANDISRGIG